MSYNLTELKEAETFYDLTIYANTASEQILGGVFMFAIFFVFILLFKRFGLDKAIAGSSFICLILSLYLSFAKLLSFYMIIVFLVILAFTGLYLYVNKTP